MFIQTETTSNPASLKFLPGQTVLTSGTADFQNVDDAASSPLAQRLFEIEGVVSVYFDPTSIILKKTDDKEWQILKPLILGAIMEHFTAGKPVLLEEGGSQGAVDATDFPLEDEDADPEIIAKIKDLIDTRIRPAASQDGGDVIYKGFKDGTVLLELIGSGVSLLVGIDNMLRHYVPEVTGVADFRDAIPKPGMDTEEARIIQQLLDEKVNPAVASHGGHIALVDVQDDTVYIRLEGGCQGCGMADVTLKQGVATEIQGMLPNIAHVLDVTDHAGGDNPYFSPGKGGMGA
jgi:Fe-S cluster biogenesis protein NfuA